MLKLFFSKEKTLSMLLLISLDNEQLVKEIRKKRKNVINKKCRFLFL